MAAGVAERPAANQELAPAKVNLTLRITGQRADGKHTLDSLVVFANIADRITLTSRTGGPQLTIDGPFAAGLPTGVDNLVLRAAAAVAAQTGAGLAFRLEKNLPSAAGIGGGSADAAATLRLLARVYGARGVQGGIQAIAPTLGADVPVCLASRAARMRGIGELVEPVPELPPLGLCLVNPGVTLSTARVFAAFPEHKSPPADLPRAWTDAAALAADLRRIGNDLAATAITLCPPIALALAAIAATGALGSGMSGSGATCFGLYRDAPAAADAARKLGRNGWWCWGGGLAAAPDLGPWPREHALRSAVSRPMTAGPWGVAKRQGNGF